MTSLCVAICTFNRSQLLSELISAIRRQQCECPYDILVIDNNSHDDTQSILIRLAQEPGPPLRYVREPMQGIVHARNRAITECLNYDYIAFIDDDEIPEEGWLQAAYHALHFEGADCVGGKIKVNFDSLSRPAWLNGEIAGFLGHLDYGPQPLWIENATTPVWTGNIAYCLKIFRNEKNPLRFDSRYNRKGADIGGGEDLVMFRKLIENKSRIRYRPDMIIGHRVEAWKLKRLYFLKLHYRTGFRKGRHDLPDYPKKVMGIPPFMISQLVNQSAKILLMWAKNEAGVLRQAMNATHTLGTIFGYAKRDRTG